VGGVLWHIMPKRRKVILRNLRIAFAGGKDISELEKMAKATFCRSVANLVSALRTAQLSPSELSKIWYIENPELLDEALSQDGGLVLLLAHMGNWELLSRLVHLFPKGSKIGGFYRPLNNPIMDQRVLARRQADGAQMFSKRDNPLHVASFLREGGIVGILADQRVGHRGEVTEFFGRVTRSSPLPSLLARRSKSTVLALSMQTVGPGKWKATFVPVSDPPTTNDCMASLEQAMKASPLDVFWFQDRWKIYINKKRTAHDWIGSATRCGRKHHRGLLWLAGVAEDWRIPEGWIHPDLVFEVMLEVDKKPPGWLPNDTRFHYIPANAGAGSLGRAIARIDNSDDLPLDFILTTDASLVLHKACSNQLISLVSLP
jgi:KDO2-lipid IV(A) lauroyltransferase